MKISKNFTDFYTNGKYLANNPTWDSEDAPWKTKHLMSLFQKYLTGKEISSIAEVGCGSGAILIELSKNFGEKVVFAGYDISEDALSMARALTEKNNKKNFSYELSSLPTKNADLVICADVFEHVENPFEFLRGILPWGKYFLFNIPLDLSVQSLLREEVILAQRKRVGHINYYTKNLALETLKDCGYTIIGSSYGEWYKEYPSPSFVTSCINVIRNLWMRLSPDSCVKILGGSSLVVLAEKK
jgi:SAM-dependent methyltransferase